MTSAGVTTASAVARETVSVRIPVTPNNVSPSPGATQPTVPRAAKTALTRESLGLRMTNWGYSPKQGEKSEDHSSNAERELVMKRIAHTGEHNEDVNHWVYD